ncbi:flagellar motor protein MotB [Primorskyibacter sp. S87]|uniref:flagellar motor protein MotB n=1 Tax=Primorskyibacter sp. S87 TaxID=3415126 RepID=UPI003C7CFD53
MGAQTNVAPVIIKRKKVAGGDGHHGGAWKVAYADFVTAMMAFFMLMWLLNATTEQQRKGLADYFSPSIPISPVSGGGRDAFGGDSLHSEMVLPKNGTGALNREPADANRSRGATGVQNESDRNSSRDIQKMIESDLLGRGGESDEVKRILKHIVTRISDEGLIIDIYDLPGEPLFEPGTATATPILQRLLGIVSDAAANVTNSMTVTGHIRAHPVVLVENPVWTLSISRATEAKRLLEHSGTRADRFERVTGHADRDLVADDPMSLRNNRVEVTLLRSDLERGESDFIR